MSVCSPTTDYHINSHTFSFISMLNLTWFLIFFTYFKTNNILVHGKLKIWLILYQILITELLAHVV